MDELKDSHKKFFKQFSNGITHNLILWIISKESIHGYGIMKRLEDFFDSENYDIKTSSSKIYPILRKMEKTGLIVGEWEFANNKRVKYYSITDDGNLVLDHIKSNMHKVFTTESWLEYFNDMGGGEIAFVKSD